MERRLGCAVRLVKVVSDDDYIVGDANNDGKVDAADIVFVVSYINGKSLPGFNEKAANADGYFSIQRGYGPQGWPIYVNNAPAGEYTVRIWLKSNHDVNCTIKVISKLEEN